MELLLLHCVSAAHRMPSQAAGRSWGHHPALCLPQHLPERQDERLGSASKLQRLPHKAVPD